MNVVLSPEAVERFEAQISYLRSMDATDAAEWLRLRVIDFLSNHLANFPRSGRRLAGRDLWEVWIPRTRLVLWYQIEQERVVIVTVWHTSQDRSPSGP